MKKIIELFVFYLLRLSLWFRYRVKVTGLEKLNSKTLTKPGGVLFLPNHPAVFIDPVLVSLAVWRKFPIRPMVVEYMYYLPVVNYIMRLVNALPVPNFSTSANSLKKKRSEQVIQEVINSLKMKQNFLIYPAGKTKSTGYESIGGASGIHRIIHEAPEANIVLIRTKGLWGSSFSRAFTGLPPPLFPTLWAGIKIALKNLLFFTPRRDVIIELELAPPDFPFRGSRLEINKFLESWYNKPDGLTMQKGKHPGDSFILVSYSIWGEKYPELPKKIGESDEKIILENIPVPVQEKVRSQLAKMTDMDPEKITPEMDLANDLGMDSLDTAELLMFLQDQFDVQNILVTELTSVKKLMALAAKQIVPKQETTEEVLNVSKWTNKGRKKGERIFLPEGKTIPEVFLKQCDKNPNIICCTDIRSGTLTYRQLKTRVLLLADYIKTLPGEYIGVLLPASVGAMVLVLAIQMAKKTPLMVNWTVGPRHLESVIKLSQVQVVLTSWGFIDRLENVDLDGMEERLVMLEEVRHHFGLKQKLKAAWKARYKASTLIKSYGLEKVDGDSKAVLLFTSGTESMPKGVPLSHKNILSNQKSVFETLEIRTDDVIFGILPPFHAFGFTISGLIGILGGMRVAYSPDPTDGKRLANGMDKWQISILCGAPTFVKGMLKSSRPDQLKNLRLCVTGAEKAPQDLFNMMDKLGGKLFEGYGITECSPVLTFNKEGNPQKGVGHPLPGIQLLIVHPETHEPLKQGERGLILARGDNIFDGYLNPGLCPFAEVNGKKWYKTGDLGYLDKENNLILSGRMKRFIKIGGEMVSLAAIEDTLIQAAIKKGWPLAEEGPSVAVCAKEITGEKTKIYVFTKFPVQLEELNLVLREGGFSNLVRISSVTHLAEIPLMGTGKINYRSLENEFLSDGTEKNINEPTLSV